MNKHEALKAARERIADPSSWTQGSAARDHKGVERAPDDDDATCWCAWGACWIASKHNGALEELGEAMGTMSIGEFNDSHTHAEVLAAFDKAIEATK